MLGCARLHQLTFAFRRAAHCQRDSRRSTITRAVGEVRPLLAERGCTVSPDVRLRSLAEVVDARTRKGCPVTDLWHMSGWPGLAPGSHPWGRRRTNSPLRPHDTAADGRGCSPYNVRTPQGA